MSSYKYSLLKTNSGENSLYLQYVIKMQDASVNSNCGKNSETERQRCPSHWRQYRDWIRSEIQNAGIPKVRIDWCNKIKTNNIKILQDNNLLTRQIERCHPEN